MSGKEQTEQLIREYMNLMRNMRRMKPRLGEAVEDLTDGEAQILLLIDHMDVPVPSKVSRIAKVSNSALSQMLGSLEEKGRITRERSEKDSRSVVLALTKQGEEDVASIKDCGFGYMVDLVDYIGEEDFARFLDMMRKIQKFQLESGAFERKCRRPCGDNAREA